MTLEGSLHDLSLIDLLQLFRIGVKTGVLWLIGGEEQGALYVRAGCLIDAVLVRGSARQVIATADDAVIYLLQWQDARFTFQPDAQVDRHPERMAHDQDWLVREARRLHRRAAYAAPGQSITLDTCFALAVWPAGAARVFRLTLAQWRVLCQVALAPSARTICARGGMAPDQALAELAQLLVLGLVEIKR
jgi:hypothetical protein